MAIDWSEDIAVADLQDEPALSDELSTLLERLEGGGDGMPHVVLNFGAVSYVNSSTLAAMLRLRKAVVEQGRNMKLCAVNADIWSVLQVTGLDRVFSIAPDPMTALATLQLENADE